MWTGKYLLMKVEAIVSADLSGMRKASSQPIMWSIIVRMCLSPELDYCILLLNLWQSCQMACLESLSSEVDRLGLGLFSVA